MPPKAPGTTSSQARPRQPYGAAWGPGFATFQYPNLNRASTIWYHDHTLGMTRLNVYAGPAGFFIIRGGPDGDDAVLDTRSGQRPSCPAPLPRMATNSRPTRPIMRSPSPSRTAPSMRTALSSTRIRASSSTRSSGPSSRGWGAWQFLTDLEPRVLRQHDHGQRQYLALPDGRTAPLSLPLPERMPVPLPVSSTSARSPAWKSGRSATRADSWPHRST
jgi:hypothetical protein